MDNATIKSILKIDLGISVEAYDELIEPVIERTKEAIKEMGITIRDTDSDGMLVEQYAAWILRKRKENVPFPRMLRHQLNNRLLSEKMALQEPETTEQTEGE